MCTKGTDHPNEKCLAFRWQLCRAGFVCRGWSGAVYVARRPDLFQLCPGKKIFSPVSLDSLDIHRGPWKIGELQYHVVVGGMNKEHGVLYYFGRARRWPFLCLMSNIKPGLVARASFVHCPVAIKPILWQRDHADRSKGLRGNVQVKISPLI